MTNKHAIKLNCSAPQDYVYVCFFLICTSTFLKIRWWVGTLVLMVPMVLANLWHRDSEGKVRVFIKKTAHCAQHLCFFIGAQRGGVARSRSVGLFTWQPSD